MIDIRELKSRYDEIKKNISDRYMNVDLDRIIADQDARSALLQEVEALRARRNENAAKMKGRMDGETRQALIAEGKALKEELAEKEAEFNRIDAVFQAEARTIPNYAHPDAPVGKEDKDSLYPYANEEYRNIFRHTLWMVPGVKEARALSAMLQTHLVFQHFKVVNVAGDGDEESRDALKAVEEAIGENPDATRTITLSCVRLTTGVSVKAWTAVFMLSGSYNTAASGYMQTIFRVQTPAIINGRMKEQCYVFDFAPDRTLKVIAETAKISAQKRLVKSLRQR